MTHNLWLIDWILEWRFVQNNALEKLEISVGIICIEALEIH